MSGINGYISGIGATSSRSMMEGWTNPYRALMRISLDREKYTAPPRQSISERQPLC